MYLPAEPPRGSQLGSGRDKYWNEYTARPWNVNLDQGTHKEALMRFPFYATTLAAVSCASILAGGNALGAQRTMIPFADLGNIRDWRSDDANELYVQSANRNWYRITFWAPCNELPFAIAIAFVTDPSGQLDEYSSILVDGERCWFKTFQPSSEPASKSAKGKDDVEEVK
jgi:hypothetical protein